MFAAGGVRALLYGTYIVAPYSEASKGSASPYVAGACAFVFRNIYTWLEKLASRDRTIRSLKKRRLKREPRQV